MDAAVWAHSADVWLRVTHTCILCATRYCLPTDLLHCVLCKCVLTVDVCDQPLSSTVNSSSKMHGLLDSKCVTHAQLLIDFFNGLVMLVSAVESKNLTV